MLKNSYILLVILLAFPFDGISQAFPDRVVGTWTGVLKIYKGGAIRDSVAIRLTVKKDPSGNAWPWKTEYLSEKLPMTKDYTLRMFDANTKTYHLDEGDGVVLIEHLFENKMYSVLETSDILLTSSYELRNDQLIFEVTSGKKLTAAKDVVNYSVTNLQRAVLKRIP